MRTCDQCGVQLGRFGQLTFLPKDGGPDQLDLCDLCGKRAMATIRRGIEESKESK